MIEAHFGELEAVTSTRAACDLLGVSRATRSRRRRPPVVGPPAPRPAPPNKLTEQERQRVLTVLRSTEHCDLAPAQVWARLLDDGIYLCSVSTMYRLLAVAGENRERRRRRSHTQPRRSPSSSPVDPTRSGRGTSRGRRVRSGASTTSCS